MKCLLLPIFLWNFIFLSFCLCLTVFFFPFFSSCAKGGGQEIKELPRRSPSVHISVGARENGTEGVRERRRGVRVASALGSCSSSLFHCFFGCYFVPALRLLINQFIFLTLMWDITAVKKQKRNRKQKKKKTLLARVFYFVPLLISKVLFVSFLC